MFAVFFRGLVACVAAMMFAMPALATQVSGLFESQRLVADQLPESRVRAVQSGLAEVLLKVSGRKASLDAEQVKAVLAQAEQYLAQYSYHENPLGETGKGQAGGDQAALLKYRLKMNFDSASLMQILNRAQLPVWGSNRPNVMVWLVIEGASRRFIVNSESNPLLSELLENATKRRGVPITLPLMDLQDEQLISVSDIWGQFGDRITAASVRYSPDTVLSGRFYRDAKGLWQARWLLQTGKKRESINLKAEQLGLLFTKSANALAESLAAKYAVVAKPGKSGEYAFSVKGVESVGDYAQLNQYLGSLQVVQRVEITRMEGNTIGYRVALNGNSDQFLSVVRLDSFLKLDDSSMVNEEVDFFWQGQK